MKATEKKWLNHHSAHDYEALITRWKKLARKSGLEIVPLAKQGDYETIALRGSDRGESEGLYLSSGVHGDEPASIWGLLEWAEANPQILKKDSVVILPCVNPWGMVNNVRVDIRGRDLNRMFQNKTLPFFRAWRKLVGDQQFRMALNLHEDYGAQGRLSNFFL
jgi:protein MpaA